MDALILRTFFEFQMLNEHILDRLSLNFSFQNSEENQLKIIVINVCNKNLLIFKPI